MKYFAKTIIIIIWVNVIVLILLAGEAKLLPLIIASTILGHAYRGVDEG